jgi:hypothetical protein
MRQRVFLTEALGAATLPCYMRRKAVHLIAAIAESFRFLAVVFLAFDVGALLNPSVSSLLRYAAAPQLLFAAGFFFLWLDPRRYAPYRPLLLIGKAANILCFLPLAMALMRDPQASASAFGLPFMGFVFALYMVFVDLGNLALLILMRPEPEPGAPTPGQGPSGGPLGQGPDDIEQVENL